MKKVIVTGVCTILFVLFFAPVMSFAGGCTARCKFSTCTIGGCTGQYACGCYFGIASCKCEPNSTGTTTKKEVSSETINHFGVYAMNSGSRGLLDLANTLKTLNENNYDQVLATYKAQIEQLSAQDMELLTLYLEP